LPALGHSMTVHLTALIQFSGIEANSFTPLQWYTQMKKAFASFSIFSIDLGVGSKVKPFSWIYKSFFDYGFFIEKSNASIAQRTLQYCRIGLNLI
jgi:hypothetical protein